MVNGCSVLILVVVEDVLVLASAKLLTLEKSGVLILVVVEDVLVHTNASVNPVLTTCLNPCCGGRCSSTYVS